MSEHTTSIHLSEESSELKKNIYNSPKEKRNYWFFDADLRKKHGLSLSETVFLAMIQQLQCIKDGFCRAKNYYFIENMGISDEWIRLTLIKFQKMGLLWYHTYNTKNGMRRHIVTSESIRLYQSYLKSYKSWTLLKKFQQEFALIPRSSDPSSSFPQKHQQESQTVNTFSLKGPSDRPPQISGDDPPQNSGGAINTTYLPNRKNDVTCKKPNEEGKEPKRDAAAFSLNLKKELEESFPIQEAEIGMKWYEMQSSQKKGRMKKPIACIIKAITEGYAHKEVSENNSRISCHLEENQQHQLKKHKKKKESESNKMLAKQLVIKFSHLEGWRHKMDSTCFVVYNDSVEKFRDENTGACICYMPDGSKRFGAPAVRVEYDISPHQFRTTLKEFLFQSQWTPHWAKAKKQA